MVFHPIFPFRLWSSLHAIAAWTYKLAFIPDCQSGNISKIPQTIETVVNDCAVWKSNAFHGLPYWRNNWLGISKFWLKSTCPSSLTFKINNFQLLNSWKPIIHSQHNKQFQKIGLFVNIYHSRPQFVPQSSMSSDKCPTAALSTVLLSFIFMRYRNVESMNADGPFTIFSARL